MNRRELLDELKRAYNWSEGTFDVWDEFRFRCAYCDRSFLQSLDAYKQAKIDHLLPQSRYPKLIMARSNLVLSCDVCNNLKRSWDANEEGERVVDPETDALDKCQRKDLLARAVQYVQRKRIEREAKFLREKEMITSWLVEGRPD